MWTVVVQAGGSSKRMGRNKALVPFRGQPLIARVIERVKDLGEEILVVAGHEEEYRFLKVRIVTDLINGFGPLGGLFTGFHYAQNPYVLVVACDMPFLNAKLLQEQQKLLVSGSYDAVVPSQKLGFEPLHAAYRRENCLAAVKRAIDSGERRAVSWFTNVVVREYHEQEVRQVDEQMLSFWNINTQLDLELAEKIDKKLDI